MEIYRNASDATLTVEVPASIVADPGTSVDVVARVGGVVVHTFTTVLVSFDPSGFTVTLPWELVREDGDYLVEWTVNYLQNGVARSYREKQFVQIVTPILPISEVSAIGQETSAGDARDLERRVRYAIQSYTGQNFGKYRTTIEVTGTNTSTLILPAPLLELERTDFSMSGLRVSANGYAISGEGKTWFGIKDAPPESIQDQFYYTNGPIRVGYDAARFPEIGEYRITGLWGYHDTPADVKQAARTLVDDYSCDESLWRERYIESVRSGNWRFETSSGAFAGTGNVLVDQILTPYRRLTMRIV